MSLTEPNQRRISVVYQDVDDLKPRTANPRTHSKKQIAQIGQGHPAIWFYQSCPGR